MVQRAGSARVTVPFQVTPMLLTTLVAAVLSTVLLAVLWYVDANPGPPPPPPPGDPGRPPPPPESPAALAVAVSIFATAWISVIVVACRDQILRRIDHAAERFAAATLEFAEQREQEGIFRGMQLATPTDPGSGESGLGDSSGGAHVVPFPRLAPPPTTSDD